MWKKVCTLSFRCLFIDFLKNWLTKSMKKFKFFSLSNFPKIQYRSYKWLHAYGIQTSKIPVKSYRKTPVMKFLLFKLTKCRPWEVHYTSASSEHWKNCTEHVFNSIQDGWRGDEKAHYQFSTSKNLGIIPENILTSSFDPFATLV